MLVHPLILRLPIDIKIQRTRMETDKKIRPQKTDLRKISVLPRKTAHASKRGKLLEYLRFLLPKKIGAEQSCKANETSVGRDA